MASIVNKNNSYRMLIDLLWILWEVGEAKIGLNHLSLIKRNQVQKKIGWDRDRDQSRGHGRGQDRGLNLDPGTLKTIVVAFWLSFGKIFIYLHPNKI